MFCGLMGLTCQSQNRPAATGPEVLNTRYFYIESKVLALTCAVFINNVKGYLFNQTSGFLQKSDTNIIIVKLKEVY